MCISLNINNLFSSGSDAASIQTRATLSEDGKHFLLNGSKVPTHRLGTGRHFVTSIGSILVFCIGLELGGFQSRGEQPCQKDNPCWFRHKENRKLLFGKYCIKPGKKNRKPEITGNRHSLELKGRSSNFSALCTLPSLLQNLTDLCSQNQHSYISYPSSLSQNRSGFPMVAWPVFSQCLPGQSLWIRMGRWRIKSLLSSWNGTLGASPTGSLRINWAFGAPTVRIT